MHMGNLAHALCSASGCEREQTLNYRKVLQVPPTWQFLTDNWFPPEHAYLKTSSSHHWIVLRISSWYDFKDLSEEL